MPVFYFHVRRGSAVYEDREGVELSALSDAMQRAYHDARTVMRDEPEVPAAGQWIEVADDHGNILRSVPFEQLEQTHR